MVKYIFNYPSKLKSTKLLAHLNMQVNNFSSLTYLPSLFRHFGMLILKKVGTKSRDQTKSIFRNLRSFKVNWILKWTEPAT